MRKSRKSATLESPTRRRCGIRGGGVTFCLGALLLSQAGCVSQLVPEANTAPTRSVGKERAAHLLTPEGTDDLSKLDDAALKARAAGQRADAETRTAAAFRYAVGYQGDDLSSDSAYRKLLHDMKQSETELDRLERELASRQERREPRRTLPSPPATTP